MFIRPIITARPPTQDKDNIVQVLAYPLHPMPFHLVSERFCNVGAVAASAFRFTNRSGAEESDETSTVAENMRNTPGPSCSRNIIHDVTGIAPSALGDGARSARQVADIARSGASPAFEDFQCSAHSLSPSTHHTSSCFGGTNTRAQQARYRRMPFFPDALPISSKPSESSKPATTSAIVANSCAACSRPERKRLHGMDFKKSRMTWSEDLHNQFRRAITDIGLRDAVPKTIMQVSPARSLFAIFHCSGTTPMCIVPFDHQSMSSLYPPM
jgi:SHAQKYF class myb-like DNA-binding protein